MHESYPQSLLSDNEATPLSFHPKAKTITTCDRTGHRSALGSSSNPENFRTGIVAFAIAVSVFSISHGV
jgi:hypothetical protein